ncbi:YfiR family protein [Methylovorus sp. MP688]|uniref:YfiR family protein n=1 Tax=Methylovorus sp. (strain MP688) TaxID=887061 RepID=UPI0001EC4568|nr:YfiR family protein [Methylovorus sp. MP688]ADQ84134.1 conserved hypothetical protein [Methylovorus sp. MP688]
MLTRRAFLLLAASLLPILRSHGEDVIPISDMRAAYLYNFVVFTEWPDNGRDTLNICLLPNQATLVNVRLLASKQINGRSLRIIEPMQRDTDECQLLYIGKATDSGTRQMLTRLAGSPVLIVGEGSQSQAMIQMNVENKRLSFNVDLVQSRRANLTISSKLLRLAKTVRKEDDGT